VEQYEVEQLFLNYGITLIDKQIDLFLQYVNLLYESNKKFNLTGFQSKKEIIKHLVLKSIIPLPLFNVPRGTSFIDIGTGPGIPGIPISIVYPHCCGVLIDSNRRKIEFIMHVAEKLHLKNIIAFCGRLEDCARMSDYRERFDNCFSRAFGSLYYVLELSSPFVKPGGIVFIYSNIEKDSINETILEQASRVGLSIEHVDSNKESQKKKGLLFTKMSSIDEKYPRRNMVIKRESKRVE